LAGLLVESGLSADRVELSTPTDCRAAGALCFLEIGTGVGTGAAVGTRLVLEGAEFGAKADNGSRAGAGVARFNSSGVPHIPQKRNPGELSSLQLGQITIVLQGAVSHSLTLAEDVSVSGCSY
jgi:hypothetical protein